jgi:non-specific serine/threonine protein kinase
VVIADSLHVTGGLWQLSSVSAEAADFVDRDTEIAEVRQCLADARLVTVLGPGGVGKTQVALRVARRAADRYPGGVRVVGLSRLREPELLANTVAASLGLMQMEARQQLDAVLDYLRPRRFLLVLDTCEHLVGACSVFAETVLRETPLVTILTTSRQPLHANGEHTYCLPPLPVPAAGDRSAGVPPPRPDSLTGAGDAAELLARRAGAADPGFAVTAATWPDVVRVCRRLDGMPLAIELAAVRLRALPLRELADRLDKRFDTLAARRGGTPRHQTLRAAIGWSYDLCTGAERALWARLSVFAGSFDVAAAEEVCAGRGVPREDIADILIGLVDKSVVLREGERYRMLDTIREFGADELAASGEAALYQGRHVAWYLRIARTFARHFLDNDQLARMSALRSEHDNLRAAMQYGLDSGNEPLIRDGAELATALYGYWAVSGRLREARHWLGLALGALPAGPSPDRAWALIVRGYLGSFAGANEDAVAQTTQGVTMARTLGDQGLLLARAYLYQEMALMFDGQLKEAFAAGAEAERRLKALRDRTGLLFLDAQIGHLHELAGDFAAAAEACQRGIGRLSQHGVIGEQWLQGSFYIIAGLALFFRGGREAQSERCFNRALPIKFGLGDIVGCGYALEGLGWVAVRKERWVRAAWLLGSAGSLWEQAGARLGRNPIMEEFHRRAVDAARQAIGGQRFEALCGDGAGYPLNALIKPATTDAEALPGLDSPPGDGGPVLSELTPRERQVAELIVSGLSNREVAARLVVSKRTVDAHVEHIFAKLAITSRVQLVGLLVRGG